MTHPESANEPSGWNSRSNTALLCPSWKSTSCIVSKSTSLHDASKLKTARSLLTTQVVARRQLNYQQVARNFPLGWKERRETRAGCFSNSAIGWLLVRFHRRTRPSWSQLAAFRSSGSASPYADGWNLAQPTW